jgi:hypothetical protein
MKNKVATHFEQFLDGFQNGKGDRLLGREHSIMAMTSTISYYRDGYKCGYLHLDTTFSKLAEQVLENNYLGYMKGRGIIK